MPFSSAIDLLNFIYKYYLFYCLRCIFVLTLRAYLLVLNLFSFRVNVACVNGRLLSVAAVLLVQSFGSSGRKGVWFRWRQAYSVCAKLRALGVISDRPTPFQAYKGFHRGGP